jgi:tRNA (guanine-N7-)-methyltransferase
MNLEKAKSKSIRSFVRRGGRITPAQRQALESCWAHWGIDFGSRVVELPAGFAALKLEIGFGNGDALIEMAASDPDSLYIGIEVHLPGVGRCLNRIEGQGLENVRLIRHDAIEVMETMLAPGSLERILLFFPDPWHKKRHHKRRIVNRHFRDLVYRSLEPGGAMHAATDWEDYAQWIAAEFLGDSRFVNQGDADGYCEKPAYRPRTRFEQRGRALGHGVWDLVFVKKALHKSFPDQARDGP